VIDVARQHTVTLRERDSTIQVRVPVSEIASMLASLTNGSLKWEAVVAKYPKQTQKE
jgi:glycyl-tRNA synthetase